MIKRLIFPLMLALMLLPGLRGAAQEGTYFQYPIVPDSIQSLEARCNYLAEHFFDFCDLKKSFSNRKRMADEFRVYLTIIANARPDVAEANATALMKKLEKQPDDQLLLGEVAEATLYGDTARMWIDGLYLPIARAVADGGSGVLQRPRLLGLPSGPRAPQRRHLHLGADLGRTPEGGRHIALRA